MCVCVYVCVEKALICYKSLTETLYSKTTYNPHENWCNLKYNFNSSRKTQSTQLSSPFGGIQTNMV